MYIHIIRQTQLHSFKAALRQHARYEPLLGAYEFVLSINNTTHLLQFRVLQRRRLNMIRVIRWEHDQIIFLDSYMELHWMTKLLLAYMLWKSPLPFDPNQLGQRHMQQEGVDA